MSNVDLYPIFNKIFIVFFNCIVVVNIYKLITVNLYYEHLQILNQNDILCQNNYAI